MSRICVKNLPKNITEARLKDLFSSKGEVTDARIAKTSKGVSRLFGFIGFRTEEQALTACAYFNHSFIGSARISVEMAKRVGDASLDSAALSKHTKKKIAKSAAELAATTAAANGQATANTSQELSEMTKAQKLKAMKEKNDFLEAVKPRHSSAYWANDERIGPAAVEVDKKEALAFDDADSDADSDDEDDVNEIDTAVAKTISNRVAGADSSSSSAKKGPVSDMDFLRSKVTSTLSDSEEEDGGQEDEEEETAADSRIKAVRAKAYSTTAKGGKKRPLEGSKKATADSDTDSDEDETDTKRDQKKKAADTTAATPEAVDDEKEEGEDEGGRLFIRNLPFSCTEEELTEAFAAYGPVSEVHLPLDAERKGKGFAFVQFMIPEHANAAKTALDGSSFQGRLMHVINAKEKLGTASADQASSGHLGKLSAYQQKKDTERRTMAGVMDSWNASFVRTDTVVSSLADKYGVSRADIMSSAESGGELAVRMAIGEAQVVVENKEFFLSHGVDLTALESATSGLKTTKRSPTTLLVKNLPFDVDEGELESMFSRFGTIASFLLPPSKTVALIDFIEPTEARNAFKGLAYRKYKHLPLYLEWAPLGVITKAEGKSKVQADQDVVAAKSAVSGAGGVVVAAPAVKSRPAEVSAVPKVVEDDMTEYSTLFIKNLSFETSEDSLFEFIQRCGHGEGLRQVSIPKKIGKDGRMLSMGFGFAEFKKSDSAAEAMRVLAGSLLDGHALQVKPSDKKISTSAASINAALKSKASVSTAPTINGQSSNTSAGSSSASSGKLIVRNVAFQATQTELRTLFSAFGSVKRVRIPKKLGGVHRGFAFVEFSSAQEAAAAMTALEKTHLYGRHLILEWAKADEDLQSMGELRKRASDQERIAGIHVGKKRKAGEEEVDMSDAMF